MRNYVFKVVTQNLRSWSDMVPHEYALIYKLDEWVKPVKGSKIVAFEDLNEALSYKNRTGRVFLCEAKGVVKPRRRLDLGFSSVKDLEAYWRGARLYRDKYQENFKFTVWCSAIKLLAEINKDLPAV